MATRGPLGEASDPSSLPRGRHGLPRELITENQRARLVSGLIESVAERGYGATTIVNITKAAKISKKTFYETFASKEDCFEAAYEVSFDYLWETVAAAMTAEERGAERVRAGLGALLDAFAAHPELASFFLIAPTSVSDDTAKRHHQAMRSLVLLLIGELPSEADADGPSDLRAEALAGGLSRLVIRKLNAGEAEKVPALLPDLLELMTQPVTGRRGAAR